MEWVLVLALGGAGLFFFGRQSGTWGALFVALALAWIGGGAWIRTSGPAPAGSALDPASDERPLQTGEGGYASSDTCRACHPAEYASWRHSYHRTMTQVVTPETMLAAWDGARIDVGREYRLEVDGDRYWVDMVDPEFDPSRRLRKKLVASDNTTRRTRRRVVQATGSHHQQVFWFPSGNGRELLLLPFTWLVPQQRFVPYEHTLLRPTSRRLVTEEWNRICIRCHATAGQPRRVPRTPDLDTHVAELGIACEACHGPAAAHVERYRNPLQRYAQYASEADGADIVNPAKLTARRSSQVCGQCHSQNNARGEKEAKHMAQYGSSYRPGDDLERTRRIYRRPPEAALTTPFARYQADALTWPDGMMRSAGRDYHGVLDSPCFRGREYSCLSCHSMHRYDSRDDQLARGMGGNRACTQCHSAFERPQAVEAHTRHRADSSGSLCYGCHMPHTSYGLLKGIRSHTVSSPSVRESIEHGRPNGCNLCHLDRTLAWTARHLRDWYGQDPDRTYSPAAAARAAAVDWLLEGDAGQRALIASAMARPEVREASGESWMPPLLNAVLDDPYPAIRLIAEHTIAELPGYEDLPFSTARLAARLELVKRAKRFGEAGGPGARVYQRPSGELDDRAVRAALARRDDRPINVSE